VLSLLRCQVPPSELVLLVAGLNCSLRRLFKERVLRPQDRATKVY